MNMNLLDSSLQPLPFQPFHHPTFTFLTPFNQLWTWIALLTATLTFWKIPSSSAAATPKSPPPPEVSPSDVGVSEPPRRSFAPVVDDGDVDGVTKGKFTAYYICDCDEDMDRDSHSQCETREEYFWESKERSSSSLEWWESWEMVLRMRMGESKRCGWYVQQDLTKLNCNVVRLWDARATSRRYSYRQSLWNITKPSSSPSINTH